MLCSQHTISLLQAVLLSQPWPSRPTLAPSLQWQQRLKPRRTISINANATCCTGPRVNMAASGWCPAAARSHIPAFDCLNMPAALPRLAANAAAAAGVRTGLGEGKPGARREGEEMRKECARPLRPHSAWTGLIWRPACRYCYWRVPVRQV